MSRWGKAMQMDKEEISFFPPKIEWPATLEKSNQKDNMVGLCSLEERMLVCGK